MEQIKSAIEALIEQLSHKKGAAGESEFEKIIKKLLTKEELKHIKLNNFKNGVLSIKVDSSAWIYKINLRKIELLS